MIKSLKTHLRRIPYRESSDFVLSFNLVIYLLLFPCQTLTIALITHVVMADRVWMVSATTHVAVQQDLRVIIVKRVG